MESSTQEVPSFSLSDDRTELMLPDRPPFKLTPIESVLLKMFKLRERINLNAIQVVEGVTGESDWTDSEAVDLVELLVQRLNRRLGGRFFKSGLTKNNPSGVITIGNLTIDDNQKFVKVEGKKIHFTRIEFCALYTMARISPSVMSHKDPWHPDDESSSRTPDDLKVYIRRLRVKLQKAGSTGVIVNARGFGYSIQVTESAGKDQ